MTASKHHDRLFMLTTGLWITPLCNEDKYALAFISRPPSPFNLLPSTPRVFFYPFRQLVIFFPPLPCVFMLLSVYTCTCVTQIAVDGFNQMAAPFCCFSVVSLPVYGSLPFGVLRRAQLRKKQRGAAASALCQKCRDKKRKKEKKKRGRPPPTQRRILTELVSGQMQCFGSHTSLSVVSSAIFLCTVFKEKKCVLKISKKKKVYKCKTTKKNFFLREGFELHPVSLFAVHCSFVYS